MGLDVDDGDAEDDEEGSPDQGCLAAAVPSPAEHRIAGALTPVRLFPPFYYCYFSFDLKFFFPTKHGTIPLI